MGAAQRHDKEQPALLVLEEQVLGVPAGQLALQPGAFRDREHRLVLDRLGGDAEVGQAGKQVLAGGGHARMDARTLRSERGRPHVLTEWAVRSATRLAPMPGRCRRPGAISRAAAAPALANSAPLLHKTGLASMDAGVAQG